MTGDADGDPLARLAALHGIAPGYTDIRGRYLATSDETRRVLLRAIGYPAGDADEVAASLAATFSRRRERLARPVVVVPEDAGDAGVELTLPAEAEPGAGRWRLVTEAGDERQGDFDWQTLERLDTPDPVAETRRLVVAAPAELGYHRLEIALGERRVTVRFIVTPTRCYQPAAIGDGGRVFGPAVQLYALRSVRNWGMGDFTDLAGLVRTSADGGADVVALNPLHSLFPHEPERASPYSPSSRLYWNPLYLDVEAVPEFAESEEARALASSPDFLARLASARDAPLVDYAAVAGLKDEIVRVLWNHFRERHLDAGTERGRAFAAWREAMGDHLERYARYDALALAFRAEDEHAWGWPAWPEAYRDPESPAVARFAAEHADEVGLHCYRQWLAETQLEAVGRDAAERHLGVGLYLDLPVSVDRGGADVWADPSLYATGVSIGAPPDDYNPAGQDWGLPPWIPEALEDRGYEPFAELLRRNMHVAGALRLDHVMALLRLYWVPAAGGPGDGAYVHYPLEELLGLVALESVRNRCLVIGEDLGTVPEAVREALGPRAILCNRLFYFEKDAAGEYRVPADYPRQALVSVSNHDLPTFAGFWTGRDLAVRRSLGLFPDDAERERQLVARAEDRMRVVLALEREGLLEPGTEHGPIANGEAAEELVVAVHRYVARTPSQLMTFQLEDALGMAEQVNMPGTVDEYPNWRYKLVADIEAWGERTGYAQLVAALAEERGHRAEEGSRDGPVTAAHRATYRLQLHRDMRFTDVERLVPYLDRLGVSHCYLSPFLEARPGSTHGYDVIDHRRINPEIGTAEDFERLSGALAARGMGQIADLVPNHMGVMGSENAWWQDVLENGQSSRYATYFDIDWQPLKPELRDKVLVPVLGDHYGRVLERGELELGFDAGAGSFAVSYYEHVFPVDPASYGAILGLNAAALEAMLGGGSRELLEYQSIVRAFEGLPDRRDARAGARTEREREASVSKRRLADLCASVETVAGHVAANVAAFRVTAGASDRYERMHALLERQPYRLAFWRVAADEINYRRFFDINDLAGLSTERDDVFEATHCLLAEHARAGRIDGFRIDHPDGLYDPAGYFERLRERVSTGEGAAAPFYVLAEKILAPFEHLREEWAVDGTTGYDYANAVSGLGVVPESLGRFNRYYRDFTGEGAAFDDVLLAAKRKIVRVHMSSELGTLANALDRIAQARPETRDFTLNNIREALLGIAAGFPVYRTYVVPGRTAAEDVEYVDWAIAAARRHDPETSPDLYAFIRARLLLEGLEYEDPAYREACARFAMKFQQYTAPVMAKALEDTSFYRYVRLVSLNEVGGDPRRFGTTPSAFHRQNRERARRWPRGMLAGSTHDSKRSEDVRARINVLTERPDAWWERVRRWRRFNRRLRRRVDDARAPSRTDEYLYYQTLAGVWPLESPDEAGLESLRSRLIAYMVKAAREAKLSTSWSHPSSEYEEALAAFVGESLRRTDSPFVEDLDAFTRESARDGLLASLGQVALRLTSPGVPDVYQGGELWDFSLVDPDNRRPVDYGLREQHLTWLEANASPPTPAVLSELLERLDDGRLKLCLVWRLLALRREHPDVFSRGDYLPLTAEGALEEHVVAYARAAGTTSVIVVVGRWFARLGERRGSRCVTGNAWDDTRVRAVDGVELAADWRDWLSGREVPPEEGGWRLERLFADLPIAVLVARH